MKFTSNSKCNEQGEIKYNLDVSFEAFYCMSDFSFLIVMHLNNL